MAERNHSIHPATLKNGTGNEYQIDAVIFDANDDPIVIIDPKYIRNTKHNRDKGSWLCTAHYNLRKTHPKIRKSIAVLGGRWSPSSKALIRSFGIHILEVPFANIAAVLANHGVDFDWPSKSAGDRPREAWEAFCILDDDAKTSIAEEMKTFVQDDLIAEVVATLDTDIEALPRRISSVEVLLKTEQDEMVLLTFDSVAASLREMTNLVYDRPDVGDLLEPRAQ